MMNRANAFKKPLLSEKIYPVAFSEIKRDANAFQGYKVKKISEINFPFVLGAEEMIIDFGDHYTGYLNMEISGCSENHIPDSPTLIDFSFAEMPVELMEECDKNAITLSCGWLQKETKAIVFMPYSGKLERRYSFRYLKLKRSDSLLFNIKINSLYLEAVSAVKLENAEKFQTTDKLLERIDNMCVKTLKECEQDVFEDGPKRDRRLWIGDLRLQALVDYRTFKNIDLIKRCIYLFADNLNDKSVVAPCIFPDTPPYIDQWVYLDYSLCLILCIWDYYENTQDKTLPEELYDVALAQIKYADKVFDRISGEIKEQFFIDHGDYDRTVAALGYLSYVLGYMIKLADALEKNTDYLKNLKLEVNKVLFGYFDCEKGLFVTKNGEISWQSQVWGAFSGVLELQKCKKLLEITEKENPKVRISSPFMTHYYLEALFNCGETDKAFAYIKKYWGAIANAGFDCCPECFDLENERVAPYKNVVLNSACHAWSCTPSYWIRKYFV